jgi:K+ transporter
MIKKDSDLSGAIKALGLVFGDIGTSPIYTFLPSSAKELKR